MNVIDRRRLQEFYNARPERKQHASAFEQWFKLARKADWGNFKDCRATFGQTDVAKGRSGRTATIFDIGGNKYRIVASINYERRVVLIKAVMTHAEYDKGNWKRLF